MNKMCVAYLGALLLSLHLISSQVVHAQYTQVPPINGTTSVNNGTGTTPPEDNGSGTTNCFTLLLPLAVAASLLHGWS